MIGLSTIGSISLGWALVAGRNLVPRPATGMMTFFIAFILVYKLLNHIRRDSEDIAGGVDGVDADDIAIQIDQGRAGGQFQVFFYIRFPDRAILVFQNTGINKLRRAG